jgi:hypothetical protein
LRPEVEATASASRVFPVPGTPYRRTPRGIRTPTFLHVLQILLTDLGDPIKKLYCISSNFSPIIEPIKPRVLKYYSKIRIRAIYKQGSAR